MVVRREVVMVLPRFAQEVLTWLDQVEGKGLQ